MNEAVLYIIAGLILLSGVILIVRPDWKEKTFAFFPFILVSLGGFLFFLGKNTKEKKQKPTRKQDQTKRFDFKKGKVIDEKINEIEARIILENVPDDSPMDDYVDALRKRYSDSSSKK